MIQRNLYISNNKSQIKKEKLVLVREGVLYGLLVEKYKSETTSLNRDITSTPNFIFYDNNQRCLIDYTNQTNKDIESKIGSFFNQLEIGVTFEISNGSYNDTNLALNSDVSGIYTFKGFYKGIVETEVNSVTSLNETINRFDKNRFEEIPYITVTSLKNTTLQSIIKNRFGKNTKNSFDYLGVKVGDYIKITEMSSPAKISDMNVDADGNEYLVVDMNVDSVDLTNLQTSVLVYVSVIDGYSTEPDLTETEVGSCIEYLNGIFVSCTNNHTLSQCRFRSSESKGITTEITLGTFCATPETDTAVQKDTTTNLIQITNALVNSVSNLNNISGPVLKNSNSKTSFYGRPF